MSEPTGSGTPIIPGYRNLERIGRGGFSYVYKAEQINLGRTVAIKILLTDLDDEAEVRRFTNECQILGRLGAHRNIVDVHDADVTADGRPYIVMKFYGRGSLGDRIKVEGPMPAREVISVGIKMATALLAAHEIGVIHRDVKPDNILVDDNDEPVLTDFGVAAIADAGGRYTTSIAFSHAHVAPEVLDGNAFGPLSDIYSLGSTLYTLLTGRAAFAADTEVRQFLAIMHAEPPAIDIPRVPQQLIDVIFTSMNKDRDARFPDAGAMATALEQIVFPTAESVDATDIEAVQVRTVVSRGTTAASSAEGDSEATRIRPSTRPPVVPEKETSTVPVTATVLRGSDKYSASDGDPTIVPEAAVASQEMTETATDLPTDAKEQISTSTVMGGIDTRRRNSPQKRVKFVLLPTSDHTSAANPLNQQQSGPKLNSPSAPQGPRTGRRLFLLAGVSIFVVALAVAVFYVHAHGRCQGGANGSDFYPPNLVGMQQSDAEQCIADAGLSSNVADDWGNHHVTKGYVLSQNPPVTDLVRQGYVVSILVEAQ